ncbi:AI-2E family transporter [Melioribacteraceae bacterium 4301-Me]|uniref:AI-2E family transporter n=1 Tax=Pyranulibacter aquaticus TaxID=3163344 RepID=UPI00359BB000
MKRRNSDPTVKFFTTVIGLFVILLVMKELQHIFIPFIIAYFLFFLFEPLNNVLTKNKIPRWSVIFIDVLITAVFIWGISRFLIDSFTQFKGALPLLEGKLNNIVSAMSINLGIKDEALTHFNLTKVLQELDYSGIASGLFSSTLSLFSSVFFVLFFFIFISSGHNRIFEVIRKRYVEKNIRGSIKKIKRQLNEKDKNVPKEMNSEFEQEMEKIKAEREEKLKRTFKDITEQVQRYITTKFLISLITGSLIGIVLWVFGVEFAIIWAVLSVLLNFIPNIGSALAVILASLMTLVQFESISYTLIVAVFLILIQNLMGNVVEPKIFGDRLGLNPIVILLSLLIWGYLWGIVGMFLSVPLTAIIKIIISSSSSKNLNFISNLMGN